VVKATALQGCCNLLTRLVLANRPHRLQKKIPPVERSRWEVLKSLTQLGTRCSAKGLWGLLLKLWPWLLQWSLFVLLGGSDDPFAALLAFAREIILS